MYVHPSVIITDTLKLPYRFSSGQLCKLGRSVLDFALRENKHLARMKVLSHSINIEISIVAADNLKNQRFVGKMLISLEHFCYIIIFRK